MHKLQQLLSAGLGIRDLPGVGSALEHLSDDVELRYLSSAQTEALTDAQLGQMLRSRPAMLTDLLTPANVSGEFMERVIRAPHKPTTQSANKVGMHQAELSPFAVDYIRDNGGKVAYTYLWERHHWHLTTADLLGVQSTLFHKFRTLADPSHLWARSSNVHNGWRTVLQQTVDLLSQADEVHKKGRGFSRFQEYVIGAALETGLPVPDELVGASGRGLFVQGLVDWATGENELSAQGRTGGTPLCRNREFQNIFAELPDQEQAKLYGIAPSWELLNLSRNPGALWSSQHQPEPRYGTQVPTYHVLRSLPVSEIQPHRSPILTRIVFRYLENTLGSDHDAWVTFESLYDSWTGTFGELMDTVTSMH